MLSKIFLPIALLSLIVMQTLLVGGATSDDAPAWSPDGSRIAFLRTENGPSAIYEFLIGDTEPAKLTSGPPATFPVWSPSGNQIAYIENGPQGHSIHVMNVDGSQDRRILEWSDTIQNLVWSPNGNRLASTSNQELFVVLPDGEELDVLVKSNAKGVSPTWSPQGNQIAFVKRINASENTAIVVIDADGENAKVLIERPTIASVVWSPNGQQIAFVYREGSRDELAVVNLDSTGFTRLTANESVGYQISWSPDNSRIAYSHSDVIHLVSPDGTQKNAVSSFTGRAWMPIWSPDGNYLAYFFASGYPFSSPRKEISVRSFGDGFSTSFEIADELPVDYFSWSPDSQHIAFHSHQALPNASLYSMATNGSAVTKLSGELAVDKFVWSPNGQQLAFVSGDLYTVDANGAYLTKLSTDLPVASYQWSPDSQKVAFVSGDLYVVDADGTDLIKLSATVPVERYEWSPRSDKIAISSGEVYVVDAKGSNFTQLTNLAAQRTWGPFIAWSPDGTKIAFSIGRIYVVDPEGGNLRQLTEGLDQGQPVWSPDGSRIAFMDYATLAIMNADGTNLIKLLDRVGNILGLTPVWSPDSKRIIFSNGHTYPIAEASTEDPNTTGNLPSASSFGVYVVNADGSGLTPICCSDYDPLLAWSPDSQLIVLSGFMYNADGSGGRSLGVRYAQDGPHSWAPDGHRLVFARKSEGDSDLYIVAVSH